MGSERLALHGASCLEPPEHAAHEVRADLILEDKDHWCAAFEDWVRPKKKFPHRIVGRPHAKGLCPHGRDSRKEHALIGIQAVLSGWQPSALSPHDTVCNRQKSVYVLVTAVPLQGAAQNTHRSALVNTFKSSFG